MFKPEQYPDGHTMGVCCVVFKVQENGKWSNDTVSWFQDAMSAENFRRGLWDEYGMNRINSYLYQNCQILSEGRI